MLPNTLHPGRAGLNRGPALVGFMAAGKTTVGRILAAQLHLPFVDTDEILEHRYGVIADQFHQDGEAAFRARERAVIEELCDGSSRVLATGGGAFADEANRSRLMSSYLTVYLCAPFARLRERLVGSERPLVRDVPEEELERRFRARQPLYQLAHLTVSGSEPPHQVAEKIVSMLKGDT